MSSLRISHKNHRFLQVRFFLFLTTYFVKRASTQWFILLICRSRFIYEGYKLEEGEGSGKTRQRGRAGEKTELNADEIKQHFRQLWTWDRDLLTKMFPMLAGRYTAGGPDEEYPTDVFFVDCLAVPPPRARPCQFTGGAITLHPQSTALNNVIESITVMKQVLQVVQGGLLFFYLRESELYLHLFCIYVQVPM